MLKALDERERPPPRVAYACFEHHPDRRVVPRLLAALEREEAEFVRPALIRALAAYGADPKVRQALTGQVMRGQDFFRGAVIEALGDYKAGYALAAITEVAKLEGPLQDDAVLAIGQDRRQARRCRCWRTAADRAARTCSRRSPRRSACSAATAARTSATSSTR